MAKKQASLNTADLKILAELEKKVLWLSSWTIHHANHVRPNVDGLKVGGHQASSASLAISAAPQRNSAPKTYAPSRSICCSTGP